MNKIYFSAGLNLAAKCTGWSVICHQLHQHSDISSNSVYHSSLKFHSVLTSAPYALEKSMLP